ncbi:MAG: BsuBI/PstI family type II restriction endonuclease [Propionibacteriaceae bacterium]|nr:deoxyribonuclease [Micropruina sp.]
MSQFCPRFTPGGQVLYLGDADAKLAIFEEAALEGLGVHANHHGKFPDLVVYLQQENWLVLAEAASSHGPVDSKRHQELKSLFDNSTAGLVFVSCFPDRAGMRPFFPGLSWETEAWVASDPDHMIHLNGDRFLGPHY